MLREKDLYPNIFHEDELLFLDYDRYKYLSFSEGMVGIGGLYDSSAKYRWKYIAKYGFVLISPQWLSSLNTFVGNNLFIDLMCGPGTISRYLHGIYDKEVLLVDDNSWYNDRKDRDRKELWHDEEYSTNWINNHPAISRYHLHWRNFLSNKNYFDPERTDQIILVSWPPYENNNMNSICHLLKRKKYNGILLFIGEGAGGCTANRKFFNNFSLIDNDDLDRYYIRFFGMNDYVYIVDLYNEPENKYKW